MTLKQLDIFLNLAETLNFRKTAEQLFLSQTTITFQIQNLEEELGARLFDRDKRVVRLTPAGEAFRVYAEKMLALMNEAENKVKAIDQGYKGFLRIGFSIDTNKAGIADLVREFSETHPEIRLSIQGGYPEKLMQELRFDRCDLFVTPYFKGLDTRTLTCFPLGRYQSVAAFNVAHPFSQKTALKYEDFEGVSYIGVTNSNLELDFTKEFTEHLRLRGIRPRMFTNTDDIDAVFLMLDANLGVSVIPGYFSERLAGSSRIKLCRIDENLKGTDLMAVWKTGNQSEELKLFTEQMRSFFS